MLLYSHSHTDAQNEEQKVENGHEHKAGKRAQKASSPAPDGEMSFESQKRPHEYDEKEVAVCDRSPNEVVHSVAARVVRVDVDSVALRRQFAVVNCVWEFI